MVARSIEPILAVRDVPAAVQFYESVLGFSGGWTWGDPPVHGGVRLGPISLQLTLNPDQATHASGAYYAVFVDDVDDWYSEHLRRGATVVSPIDNKPWGLREYTVRDLDGYLIRIGGPPT